MRSESFMRTSGLLRGAQAAAVAALTAAALAGGGPAAAAAHQHAVLAASGRISTAAGSVGGPGKATKVAVAAPCGLSFGAGNLYIAQQAAVRAVAPATDLLNTPAGTGAIGPLGDTGLATRASVGACGVAVDHSGNLVIADTVNSRVRVAAATTATFYGQAMTAGDIYTVAGNGTAGFSGDSGLATSAELNKPDGVTVDAAGNLVIADTLNNRVRVVAATSGTFYGRAMTAGDIYTVAGTGTAGFSGDSGAATAAELSAPWRTAVDANGNLVIADSANNRVRVVADITGIFYGRMMTAGDIYTVAGGGSGGLGDGGPATSATLAQPKGVAADSAGNLLIADAKDKRVRAVAAITGTFYGQAMTAGDIYTIAGTGTNGFSGDGGPATSAQLSCVDVTVDASGNVLIADVDNNRVRVVAHATGTFYGQAMTAGDIYTIAGTGTTFFSGDAGRALKATLNSPSGVAVDGAGNMLIADTGNSRIRVDAAATGTFYGKAMTAGDIYTVAGTGTAAFSGDGGPALKAALNSPRGAGVDTAGNLVIADTGNNRIRVVASTSGTFYGQAMTAGDIYTVAGTGTAGFSGDGGPATSAGLTCIKVAVDAAGNLVIADTGNNRIRVVAKTTGTFYGQAMTVGDIYTVAGTGTAGFSGDGGPATSAELQGPQTVVVDGAKNLVIADTGNSRIRVVAAATGTFYGQAMTGGDIYTVAGTGLAGFFGDKGPATSAKLHLPDGVGVDTAGNLVIADTVNNRVRVVAATTATFYGQAMTAGDIYTVAGSGAAGFSGDGGPGTSGELSGPEAVAVNGAGNALVADPGNNRIRMIVH